jgi:uncharacterized phage protein (TIGR01671 family)
MITKFRAWNKKYRRMYDVLHLHLDSYDGIWATVKGFDIIDQKDIHLDIQPKDCIIMQYTGMKDKNDKDIYEGDILYFENCSDGGDNNSDDIRGEVIFENSAWYIKYGKNVREVIGEDWDFNPSIEGQVIGNIYKNPELIDKN